MEKIIADTKVTLKSWYKAIWGPVQQNIDANLPGFGYKVLGLLGLLIGYNISVYKITEHTEAWMFLEKMRLYAVGNDLVNKGFFKSDAEEQESREEDYHHTVDRLNHLWEHALADATQTRSFDRLVEHLAVDEANLPKITKPISWRFAMMPYGVNASGKQSTGFAPSDAGTQTTGFAPSDSPAASNYFLLDIGSTGDYPDRQDNKPNPIRKGRHMYTSAYMPPTK